MGARLLYIGIPGDKTDETLRLLREHETVRDVTVLKRANAMEPQSLVTCKMRAKHTAGVLDLLKAEGVGTRFGFIDILCLQSSVPILSTPRLAARQYRVDDRVCFEEIYQNIDREIHLTFDFIALCCIAAMISSIGIISDNAALVVAAMLISPLTYPIMGACFGTLVGDPGMFKISLRNFLIGVALIIGVSLVVGALVYPFIFGAGLTWPNSQMSSIGTWPSLVAAILMAIPSGAGVAIAIVGALNATILGVAVAALLIPALNNFGLQLSVGVLAEIFNSHWEGGEDQMLILAGYSLAQFAASTVVVFLTSLLFFRLKRVGPSTSNFGEFQREVAERNSRSHREEFQNETDDPGNPDLMDETTSLLHHQDQVNDQSLS